MAENLKDDEGVKETLQEDDSFQELMAEKLKDESDFKEADWL